MVDVATQTLETLGSLYETAFSVATWPRALDGLAALVGGNGALLFVNDATVPELEVSAMSSRYKPVHATQYVSSLVRDDELRWVRMLDELPPRTVVTDLDIWPDRAAYDAMPSVRFMRELNLYHRVAVRPCTHGGWHDALTVLFDDRRDGIHADERRRLELVVPHLARAVEVQRPFALLQKRYSAVLSMLDRLGIGVLIVREGADVIALNQEVLRILESKDGLELAPGRKVAARDEKVAAKLFAAIQRTARAARLEQKGRASLLHVPRRSGLEPLVVDLAPLRDAGSETGSAFAGVLMIVIDPDHREMVSVDGLARGYGLTAAEASVCHMIAQGLALRQIADTRNVSLDTVKSQSRSIYNKTRTRNRRELVRRALSIVPPLLDEGGKRSN